MRMSEEKYAHDDAAHQPDKAAEGPATTDEVARLKQELEDARAKCQTYLDLAQRAQADFINYKRRVEQERSDFVRNARAEAILKVLPVMDDLERAVQSLPRDLAESDWAQGVVLIERKLRASLETEGVKRIEAVGEPFDPWKEEALVHEPSTDFPPGTVSRVFRTGYSMDGRVIRPAQVVVSSGPPPVPDEILEQGSAEGSSEGGTA
jgi:molecular chaperone GrpE